MKKFSKVLTVVCALALAVAIGVLATACGSKAGTYSTTFNSVTEWSCSPFTVNAYGDEAGVGLLNLDNWGDKKLKLGADGHCVGTGLTYTCTLDVDGEGAYTLTLTAHLIGAGADYTGEGDFSYAFTGTYEEVETGYKLAAPTACTVSITGTFANTNTEDLANYIPSAPWTLSNTDADDSDAAKSAKNKVVPSKLLTTIFKGATFVVEGEAIKDVTDITY